MTISLTQIFILIFLFIIFFTDVKIIVKKILSTNKKTIRKNLQLKEKNR